MVAVVAISITALIFQVFLKSNWNATGLSNIVSNINHGSTTILFIVWFLLSPTENIIQFKSIYKALIYPVIYCVFGILENTTTGKIRYFFLDIKTLGWNGFAIWFFILAIIFLLISLVIIKIDHLKLKISN